MQENININDSTINPNMTFRKLVFMNMQQLTNFPYIEKDFDALTDYQLLCKVVEYLNSVINNSNEQNTSINNLYNAFLELQTYVNNTKDDLEEAFNNLDDYVRNYFENLDVQDEINNKLNQMLEDGVLEQIIEQFIQSTALWCFDTVADMKSATNLIDGSFAKTLGYYSVNDGGGATYKITDTESLTDYQEELTSGLYATLISNNCIYSKQLGLKGDNLTDETNLLNTFFSYPYKKYIINNGNYVISNNINLSNSNCEIKFENASIRMLPNNKTLYYIFNCYQLHDVTFDNIHLIGDKDEHLGTEGEWGHCLNITDSYNITVKNSKFENAWGDGIYIGLEYSQAPINTVENILVENCSVINCSRNGISLSTGNNIKIKDCYIENVKRVNPRAGIDIEPEHSNMNLVYLDNVIIENVTFNDNSNCISFYVNNINTNVNILDCKIFNSSYGIICYGISTDTKSVFNINNIMMKGIKYSGIYLKNNDSNSYYNINNIVIEDCTFSGSVTDSEQSAIRLGLTNGDIYNLNLSNVSVKPTNINFGSAIYIEENENYKLKNSNINNIISQNSFVLNNVDNSSCKIEYNKVSNTSYYQVSVGGAGPSFNKFIIPVTRAFETFRKLGKVPRGFYEFLFLDKNNFSQYVDLTYYTNVYYEGALSTNKKFYCTSKMGKLDAYVFDENNIHVIETIGTWNATS